MIIFTKIKDATGKDAFEQFAFVAVVGGVRFEDVAVTSLPMSVVILQIIVNFAVKTISIMRKILFILTFLLSFSISNAQEEVTTISIPAEKAGTQRVYAELLGYATNLLNLNKNVHVTVDLGQFQSAFKAYTLVDDVGKEIKFNSMVAAMNYMGERGWKFVQAYIVTVGKQNVYHWLMYKDITHPSQIYEDLRVKNTETEPSNSRKNKEKVEIKVEDPIYGYM